MSIAETKMESNESKIPQHRVILLKTLVVMIKQGRFTIEEAIEELQTRPEEFLAMLEKGI